MDVLIVEDEPALLDSLLDGLREAFQGYTFRGAPSVELAEPMLGDGDDLPALIISDIRLPGKSGLEFLMDVRRRVPEVRFILMSAFPTNVPGELAEATRGIRFLRKPFELSQLIDEVQSALEGEAFTGNVEGITLIDLLQILHMGKRTAAIKVRRGNRAGAIHVEQGEIVHAVLAGRQGAEAFNEIVCWRGGSYSLEAETPSPSRTIEASFSFLLMEAMRLADEEGREENGEARALTENETTIEAKTETTIEAKTETKTKTETDRTPQGSLARTDEENEMTDINALCKELVDNAPDAVAANVVDLSTGMMLGGFFHSNFTTDHFEAVSAAVTNLYRGRETLRVENLVKAQRGDTSDIHFMEEVQFSTTHLHHFIAKLPGKESLLCLVTRKPGNIGMGWSALRAALPKIAPAVPS